MTPRRLPPIQERLAAQSTWRNGCREWTGSLTSNGYGHLFVGGRKVSVHRIAWELEHGPIPAGLLIRHDCDNPPCFHVAHLRPGTDLDNQKDSVRRGRNAFGERNGSRHLSEADVVEIRRRLARGESGVMALGREFGVSHSTIIRARDRTNWRHL